MIPKIIHQTSRHLTPEEERLSRRTRALLPGWEYRLWTDEENDALVASSFPQYLASFRRIKRGVVKADIARYMYLSSYGGFYLDTDYKVLRGIDDAMLAHRCVLPVSRSCYGTFRLGNAVLGSVPDHPFWNKFIALIFSVSGLDKLEESNVEQVTGPEGLTDFYMANKDNFQDIYLPPRVMFHPPLTRGGYSFRGDGTTIGAHLCWGSWRSKGTLGMVRQLIHRKVTSY